ncbi:aldehyde dehydrogenase family protein, partial [Sulfurimonas sp.]|uniref:aldehyde dehydrogenase family protein n=1 Tax=Sulfurimonas sp. TaxID=2022749 RepID=UPI003D0F9D2D
EMPPKVAQIVQSSSGIKPSSDEELNKLGKWMHLLLFYELSQPMFINAELNDFIEFQVDYVGDIYDEFAQKMADETKKLVVGSPYDDDTFMGPLIDDEAAERAMSWVESAIEEGAVPLLPPHREGRMFHPCVMADVTDDMAIVCEEVFAPIVSLVKVDGFDDAASRMNNSPYGLQFSVFTNDLNLTKRAIN